MAGRRMNGEGSVYKRGSTGRWHGSVVVDYVGGKVVRKEVSARTKDEVRRKLEALRRQLDEGLPPPDDRVTVRQLLTDWEQKILTAQVQPSALQNYRTIADHHIVPTLGRKRVSKLTTKDVDDLLAAKRDAGLSVSTVRRIRSVLVQALDQGVRWGLVGRNVGKATRGPKETNRRVGRTLTPEQARELLDAARWDPHGTLFIIMLTLGLRRGEALGLRWVDIDYDRKVLTVRQALRYEDGKPTIGEVKTRMSRREVDIPDELIQGLRGRKATQAQDRLRAGKLWVDSDLVFTTKVGTPLDPRNVGHYFERVCNGAGLGHWHPHELRHSAASLMLAQGVPIEVVSKVLGHSSIRITADTYGHILPAQRAAAAEAMADVLWR